MMLLVGRAVWLIAPWMGVVENLMGNATEGFRRGDALGRDLRASQALDILGAVELGDHGPGTALRSLMVR
jgi:hypothetical protein